MMFNYIDKVNIYRLKDLLENTLSGDIDNKRRIKKVESVRFLKIPPLEIITFSDELADEVNQTYG